MANGILIVDKPSGWTSQDVAAKLRGVFHERRVGHGGTLDPMATGVLPIFIGRATRGAEFLEHAEKEYVAGKSKVLPLYQNDCLKNSENSGWRQKCSCLCWSVRRWIFVIH